MRILLQKIDSTRILSSINPISYVKTSKLINRFNPDILIIPYWMPFFAPAFGIICKLINKKTKIVSLVHNAVSHEKTFLEKPLAKFFLKKCDAWIVMSEPVRNDLINLIGNTKILLQEHPIYDQYKEKIDQNIARKQLNLTADKKTLLFFGFIREYKGLDLLIEATNDLSDDYQLVIAGECYGSFVKYAELIDKSRLKDNIVVFEEYINDDMATVLFSAADVLILPYRSATQSGVIAMAYQLETPMIATNVGALGETLSKADTGIVVDEVNAQSIALGIKRFFEEDNSAMFKENIKKEKERLSWRNFAKESKCFFSEILQ